MAIKAIYRASVHTRQWHLKKTHGHRAAGGSRNLSQRHGHSHVMIENKVLANSCAANKISLYNLKLGAAGLSKFAHADILRYLDSLGSSLP